MSSLTRKHKRNIAFYCAKQGVKPAQMVAEAAARELKITQEAANNTIEIIFSAIALVAQYDFGKLNAKAKRLDNLAMCLYKRSVQVKKHQLSEDEEKIRRKFTGAVMEIWGKEEVE